MGDHEPDRLDITRCQQRVNFPVLFGYERADFPLPFHDKAHRDGLDPARRQPASHFGPQQRTDLKTDYSIKKAPRLLGMHARHIQHSRFLEGFLNSLFSNLVKDHPMVAASVPADRFLEMPGDRLALSVEVSSEIDSIAVLGELFQLTHHFLFTGQNLVAGLPPIIGVNAHPPNQLLALFAGLVAHFLVWCHFACDGSLSSALLRVCGLCTSRGGQITNMAHAGLHNEILAEIFVNGFRLGGRLHYDQCFTHKLRLPALISPPGLTSGR